MSTICEIGDGSDEKTFKHSLGSLAVAGKLKGEVSNNLAPGPSTLATIQHTVVATVESLTEMDKHLEVPKVLASRPGVLRKRPAAEPLEVYRCPGSDFDGEIAIVNKKSSATEVAQYWHRGGPLECWQTTCGEWCNEQSMTLRAFADIGNGRRCGRCH